MTTPEDARSACSRALAEKRDQVSQLAALVGLDGFVDEIIHVVDKREDADHFERIPDISAFAARIADAAGKSTNIELVTQRVKLGGNGPIMANALGAFSVEVCYVGAVGYPQVTPVFKKLEQHGPVYPIAEPAHTDALEFADGKLMLGKMTPLNDLTWPNLLDRMGHAELKNRIEGSQLVSFVNWTMIPHLSEIWEAILQDGMLPDRSTGQYAFFDLCDPEKRQPDDIQHAMTLLGRFRQHFKVILGLNEKEALELAEVYGLPIGEDSPEGRCALAERLFKALDVDVLVVHPVAYALVVTADETCWVEGPFVEKPVITTGAGDHFNAGFCLGNLLGLSPQHSLLLGVSSSGHYVRSGRSPRVDDLIGLLNDWPTR